MAHADKYIAPGALADLEAVRAELAKLALTTNQIIANQQLIQRDDGCLKDGAVKPHTVSRELLALMGNYEFLGAYERRPYRTGQLVEWDGKLYVAAEDHAGGDIPDLAKFRLLGWAGCGGAVSGSLPALPPAHAGLPPNVNVSVNLPQTVRLNVIVESVRVERLTVENVDIRAFAPPPNTLPPPNNPSNPPAGTPPPAKIDPATLPEMGVGEAAAVVRLLTLGELNTPEGRAVRLRLDGRAVAPEGWEGVCSPPVADPLFRVGWYYNVTLSRGEGEDNKKTAKVRSLRQAAEMAREFFREDAVDADYPDKGSLRNEVIGEWLKGNSDRGFYNRRVRYPEGVHADWTMSASIYSCSAEHHEICDLPAPYVQWPADLPSELVASEAGFQAACAAHDPHLHERYAAPAREIVLKDADGDWRFAMAGEGFGGGFWIDRPHWTRAVKVSADSVVRAYGEPKGGA